jgi:hypothetical protein
MAVAPFIIDSDCGKWLAIVGLLMLTIQAFHHRLINLITLNLLGAGGYFYALYF